MFIFFDLNIGHILSKYNPPPYLPPLLLITFVSSKNKYFEPLTIPPPYVFAVFPDIELYSHANQSQIT